jgi:2-methylaconitate cis-trans-isomerase PrpF
VRLVRVINSSGQPGADATVKIRGGSVNANSDPLYVVDGVPFIGNLSSINFSDIASTTVLKMLLRPLFMVLEVQM